MSLASGLTVVNHRRQLTTPVAFTPPPRRGREGGRGGAAAARAPPARAPEDRLIPGTPIKRRPRAAALGGRRPGAPLADTAAMAWATPFRIGNV